MFLPGATLQRTLELVHRDGDFFKVLLRLPKRKIVTVTLNTEYDVTCRRLSPTRAVGRSSSTSIAEVKNPGTASGHELPPGDDHGYPWRFDTFWRFEERGGGVYMEVEAVSLTRNVPRVVSPTCSTRGARRAGGEPPYGCRNAPGRVK